MKMKVKESERKRERESVVSNAVAVVAVVQPTTRIKSIHSGNQFGSTDWLILILHLLSRSLSLIVGFNF